MSSEHVKIVGLAAILRRISLLKKGLESKTLMGEIGEYITQRIITRSQAGEDVDGASFAPYASSTKLFRTKTGHQTGHVDLTMSGTMWNALTYQESKDEVRVFFRNVSGKDTDVKVPTYAYFLNENREFFALSKEEENMIFDMVKDHAKSLTRRGPNG